MQGVLERFENHCVSRCARNAKRHVKKTKRSVFHNAALFKEQMYVLRSSFCLCPQVLHHLNELGDGLVLKFSRLKYSPRPDLCDGTDYVLDS